MSQLHQTDGTEVVMLGIPPDKARPLAMALSEYVAMAQRPTPPPAVDAHTGFAQPAPPTQRPAATPDWNAMAILGANLVLLAINTALIVALAIGAR